MRFPARKVRLPTIARYFRVWNMFRDGDQPACPTWNRTVLGVKLKLEMLAPSLSHYRQEGE
ncbi:hypothetical protein EYF80_011183 [Liparis tanakae]|uniref:Uncharacterized protein n=1 Tax=Liparis tanakae TaxID=230148 RepID=A0A4Z2ILJ0_9TELE|nr:hypothetical protein EYF80_011183 [Liparis tanakae]